MFSIPEDWKSQIDIKDRMEAERKIAIWFGVMQDGEVCDGDDFEVRSDLGGSVCQDCGEFLSFSVDLMAHTKRAPRYLSKFSLVIALMDKVIEQDPTFFFAFSMEGKDAQQGEPDRMKVFLTRVYNGGVCGREKVISRLGFSREGVPLICLITISALCELYSRKGEERIDALRTVQE